MPAALASQPITAVPCAPHPDRAQSPSVLAGYHDGSTMREIVVRRAAHGSRLVIDRRAAHTDDERLVAHLAADEAPSNAALVCADYLQRMRRPPACRPRHVTGEDLREVPFSDWGDPSREPEVNAAARQGLTDARGQTYAIRRVGATGLAIPELRWVRLTPVASSRGGEVLSVRDVIGQLERYEPARALTAGKVLAHRRDPATSVATLRAELERVALSRIVLNRCLRETALRAVHHQGVSMSEIAIRCGRVKRDARGNVSGETSWLARRLGLLPEGGETRPTPWIHSDVLALIARKGLGVSPREVELS